MANTKLLFISLIFFIGFYGCSYQIIPIKRTQNCDCVIADTKTAKSIAALMIKLTWGQKEYRLHKPYTVELSEDNIWIVTGSQTPGCYGGVPSVQIDKIHGRMLFITQGK